MEPKKIDPKRVVLIPADEGAVELGVDTAPTPGKLQAVLTVRTAELGQFVVPLSAAQLHLLASVSATLLKMPAEQAARLRDELESKRNQNDE